MSVVYSCIVLIYFRISGLHTTHQVNPCTNAHLLALLHHLQGFVEEDFAGKGIVNNFDYAVCKGVPPTRRIFLHANTTPEGELYNDATSKGITNVVIPERQVPL